MKYTDGTLITNHSDHEIYLVQEGRLRWVPDAWTMQSAGVSTADLVVTTDEELEELEMGEPLPSDVPAPSLTEGQIVETESGVWRMENQHLTRVLDPMELAVQEGFDPKSVAFLPDSIVRGLFLRPAASGPKD